MKSFLAFSRKKHIYILCIFLVDIHRGNDYLFLLVFNNLIVTDAKLHFKASIVFFSLLNYGNSFFSFLFLKLLAWKIPVTVHGVQM